MDKFLGMGLKKFIGLGLGMVLFFVVLKVIFNKYPVAGVTEIVNMA